MAKGNALLGYSRGSVGDVTFSRVKGQQVSKARNRQPANPKTNKQVLQRASFINPVKFFTHGVQALFKFSFSDKKVTESDFNAFQRHNSKVSFPVTKAEYDDNGFPPLGNYLMSKGKLAEIPVVKVPNATGLIAIPFSSERNVDNIGDLSRLFVDAGYAEVGDIITLVAINEEVSEISEDRLVLLPGSVPNWKIIQFVVDVDSTDPGVGVLSWCDIFAQGGLTYLSLSGYDEDTSSHLFSMAVIRSRETALGLEVSTSYLHNGGYIDAYIQRRNTAAEVGKVLADWGATGEAILQGALAKK